MSHEQDAYEKENLEAGRQHTWRVKRVSTLIRLALTYFQLYFMYFRIQLNC